MVSMALSHAKRFNVEINSSGPNSIVYQNQLENLRGDTLQQEFVSDSDLFFENFFFYYYISNFYLFISLESFKVLTRVRVLPRR